MQCRNSVQLKIRVAGFRQQKTAQRCGFLYRKPCRHAQPYTNHKAIPQSIESSSSRQVYQFPAWTGSYKLYTDRYRKVLSLVVCARSSSLRKVQQFTTLYVDISISRAAIYKLNTDLKLWRNSILNCVARALQQWLCSVQSREEHQNSTSTLERRYLNKESSYRQTEWRFKILA